MEISLENRLNGLENIRDSLANTLRQADYSRPSRVLSDGYRYLKYDLVDYLKNDGELEQDFGTKLYRTINKPELKRAYYGMLALPTRIPKEITEKLNGWERVMFYAGVWFSRGNFDFSKPLPELITELIKKGYDGIHEMHMIKYRQGVYGRPLKIPNSQNYRKNKYNGRSSDQTSSLSENLNLRMPNLLDMVQNEDGSEEDAERIAVMLDSCSKKELWYLTARFGANRLGDYAVKEL